MLVKRTLGLNTKSLQGNPSKILEQRSNMNFFPELWNKVGKLTDETTEEMSK